MTDKTEAGSGLHRRDVLLAATTALAAASYPAIAVNGATATPAADEITALDATALSQAIKSRQVSCIEVMEAYLRRIDTFNPTYNALVSRAPHEALLEQAAAADRELAAGRHSGWMHGMPHAVKDLADLKGFVNSGGSPLLRNAISDADELFVEKLRAAGAIFIGKTNVPEWGLGSQSYNPVFGSTGCAYDPSLTAGGSSGGAACGLAAQMLPVADGSDMMGSLRNPAAFNNVIGFRPGMGRIASRGADVFYAQLATEGPLGRSVRDVAKLYQTMAGFNAAAPLSHQANPLNGELKLPTLETIRVGWLGDYAGYLPMEAGVLALCEAALSSFSETGCNIEPCTVAYDMPRLWQAWLTLRHWRIRSGAKALYDDPEKRALMKPELVWEIEGGRDLSGDDIAAASVARSDWYRALLDLFEDFDFLVLPTAQVFPFSRDLHWPKEIAGNPMDTYHRWMEVVIGGTLSGCPVINLPAGFDERGRPMGLQFIAPLGQEQKLLEFALGWEANTSYLQTRPKLVPA